MTHTLTEQRQLCLQKQNVKEHSEDGQGEGRDPQPFEPPTNPTPDPPNPSSAAHGEALAAEQGQQGLTDWQIIKQLGAYVWPKDNPEYRWRVVGASVLLVGAKGLNVTVLCHQCYSIMLSVLRSCAISFYCKSCNA